MPVSEALAVALARGARLNEGHEWLQVSFTSILIGLLAAPDATGEWLRSRHSAGCELG